MNFKNTINSTKENLKKHGKNLALSTALIASLTACGPSDKKAETTTTTDSTKTEVVAKDSVKKVDNTDRKTETTLDKAKTKTTGSEELDDETLAILDQLDANHEEEQKKLEEQTNKQTPREKLEISKETYEMGLEAIKEREATLESLYNDKVIRNSKEGLNLVKRAIDNYHKTRKLIDRPISPKAQKIINAYNEQKRQFDN